MPDVCAECRHLNQHSTGKSHDLTHNDQNCGQGADGTRKRQDSHGRQVDFEGRQWENQSHADGVQVAARRW